MAAWAERAPGPRQLGDRWTYVFAAIRPATGEDVTPVLPTANAQAMQVFLDHVAPSRPADAHAVMVLDGAGWHLSRTLAVPDTITLVLLPPYSPELDPVERVWLHLRERFLSLRLLVSAEAVLDARLATPGCASPLSQIASARSAPIHGSRKSVRRLAGITESLAEQVVMKRKSATMTAVMKEITEKLSGVAALASAGQKLWNALQAF